VFTEPDDHGLGRSRGGLTTKLHLAVEQAQKPMSLVITAGQRGDSPQFQVVLGRIRVARLGPGRPRTRPDKVRADKAYGSRANRAYLRKRGIRCTIPEKRDQIANRKKRGSHGGRPPKFDAADYKERHAVEHTFRMIKQTLGWTRPKLRTPAAADRWTWLVIAAHTQLRLTREAAADLRRPWEKPAEPARLTPARVRRGFRNLRPHLHCPARAPKPSTPGPGRPPGSKNQRPATRYDVGKTTRRPESIAERNQLKARKP
jgi:hypothetical protein